MGDFREAVYMRWIPPIKEEEKLQRFRDELRKIDEKYFIMFEIGIGTGLQLQEILRLRVGDVRNKEYLPASFNTRDVRREFRIPPDIREEIDHFTEGKEDGHFLICGHESHPDKPLSREQAYRVMRQAGMNAGLKDVGATTMRKTFAWRYYQKTGDIYYLQDLLNHTSPMVTFQYLGVKPGLKTGITRQTPDENARSRARLYQNGSGVRHIETIRNQLLQIEIEMQSARQPDAWFGKTEGLLNSIDGLLEEYRVMK